jgi:hypothetical protein
MTKGTKMAKTAEDRKLEKEFSDASQRISTRAGWITYQNARREGDEHYDALDKAFRVDIDSFKK